LTLWIRGGNLPAGAGVSAESATKEDPVKRLIPLLLLVPLALTFTGFSQAKELASFKACGDAGCKAVTAPATLRALIKGLELQGEPVTTETPAPAPFYRLEFVAKGDEGMSPSFTQYYAPSTGTISIQTEAGSWSWVDLAALQSLYRKVTAGVTPYGKPRFTRAAIGGELLSDPASYTRLFTVQGESDDFPSDPDWLPITFTSAKPSPWSNYAATLEYSPSTNTLWRGVEYIKLTSQRAGNLEDRRSFAAAASGGDFPWLPLLGGLGVAVVLLGAGVLVVRRRRAEPAPVTGSAPVPE
jgi:hypothetical protein